MTQIKVDKVFKSDNPLEIVKTIMFVNNQGWSEENLSKVVKKSLKHDQPAIKCCGGIVLRLEYNNIHVRLMDLRTVTKLAGKTKALELNYFNSEVYEMIDWIEEDMTKLKITLSKHTKKKAAANRVDGREL